MTLVDVPFAASVFVKSHRCNRQLGYIGAERDASQIAARWFENASGRVAANSMRAARVATQLDSYIQLRQC